MAGSQSIVNITMTNKENIKFFVKTVRLMCRYEDHLSLIFKGSKLILLTHKNMCAISARFSADFFDTYEVPD